MYILLYFLNKGAFLMTEQIKPLDPIAIHLGPIAVHWYGVIIGIGAILGFILATREGKNAEYLQMYFTT